MAKEKETEEEREEKEEEHEHEKEARGGKTHGMKNMGEHPGTHRGRRARGGRDRAHVHQYNAVGAPEAEEAKDESPEFKKGGHKERKAGGRAVGGVAPPRMDRRQRGGQVPAKRARGGGTPYSSGANIASPKDDKSGRGHENAGPA